MMTATDAGGGIPEVVPARSGRPEVSHFDVPAADERRSAPPHGTIPSAAVEAGPDPAEALAALLRGEGRRVLATVIRLTGDLAVAEDAVQDAAISALETWRRIGVPPNPRAWLTLAAKRRVIDLLRREGARPNKEREAIILAVQRAPDDTPPGVVRDDQAPADLHLLPPGARAGGAGRAQPARALRAERRRGRPGAPRLGGDDGQAPHPGAAQDRRRRHSLPGS
ncbi:hypothetical protein KIV56_12125 [Cryobacterium breve]|uniref:RNA polymerase sigma-70 region 2 domain-containing protein n=1 Tax=Cryobacterium breve TaxID=1259258 RepID=A0ABY7NCB3_9MICO|nr:hypothetical protein KIV56_12125 [Cryobacterium breve]